MTETISYEVINIICLDFECATYIISGMCLNGHVSFASRIWSPHCKCVDLLCLSVMLNNSNQSMTDNAIRDSNQCYTCSAFDYQSQRCE